MSQNPLQVTPVINSPAAQDILVQSGFLNHFRWANQNRKSAWIYLNKSDGKDQNGKTEYQSVLCQVFGNTARMLESYYSQITSAKASGQRMSILVQIYSGFVTSFTPTNNQGAPANPVTIMKGFKACIINPSDRMVSDISDQPRWNDPNMGQNQGGYQQAPQQNNGGYQQAPQQNNGGYQQAPQQNNGGYQQAPQHAQQPADPMSEPNFDFDDDIPF